jgi:hypothetical protein
VDEVSIMEVEDVVFALIVVVVIVLVDGNIVLSILKVDFPDADSNVP